MADSVTLSIPNMFSFKIKPNYHAFAAVFTSGYKVLSCPTKELFKNSGVKGGGRYALLDCLAFISINNVFARVFR